MAIAEMRHRDLQQQHQLEGERDVQNVDSLSSREEHGESKADAPDTLEDHAAHTTE
jgi:hypothetical protein